MNKPVVLSDKAYAVAEKQAKDYGCDTVEEYLNKLLEQDDESWEMPRWIEEAIDEGLASPSVGVLTPEKLHQLFQEGIALARQDKERGK